MPRARNPENPGVFAPGQLSYLPKRRYSDLFSPTESEVPAGCYDHPVLILSTDQRKKEAVVLILTSLGGKTLNETPWPSRIRALHLPIHPSPAHPDNGILLFLDRGLKLPKKTYVKTEKSFSIHWKLLQAEYGEPRTGRRYKLKTDSFAKLLQHVNIGDSTGHTKTTAPKLPPPVNYSSLQDIFDTMDSNFGQYGSINQPPVPSPQLPKPPKYSVQAPTATSTLQSLARSREGVAAATDRYIAQWRESQTRQAPRHEAPSILPTYHTSPPSNIVVPSYNRVSIVRRLLLILLLVAGVFLMIAWWECLLTACK